jgi:hypothetical protein
MNGKKLLKFCMDVMTLVSAKKGYFLFHILCNKVSRENQCREAVPW